MFTVDLCPLEYYVIDSYHSYCSQSYPGVIDQKITVLERKRILEMHNHE
ncbi:unnamed protein product, partial [Rotaria magnacalcarata]